MTALYRFRSEDGTLLYVGISDWPFERINQHENKVWMPLARTVEIEWYETREAAADAEVCAIRLESPRHNVQGRGGPRSKRPTPAKPAFLGEREVMVRRA